MDNKNGRQTADIRKRGHRQQQKIDLALSKSFHPRFLSDADNRIAVVRTMKRMIERLKVDAGGNESFQKEMLCQHAVFMHVLLETMETKALEREPSFDIGAFTQAINCLTGLLRNLGLERRVKQAGGLNAYMAERNGKK
jgi:hypothetical protein